MIRKLRRASIGSIRGRRILRPAKDGIWERSGLGRPPRSTNVPYNTSSDVVEPPTARDLAIKELIMVYDERLAERVRAALAERDDVVEKLMFGGIAFMVRGHMSCGIVGSTLMVRLAQADAEGFLSEPHVRPMDFTGRPMRGFLYVDPDGLKTGAALRKWVDRAAAYAEVQPKKARSGLQRKRSGRKT